MSEPPPLSRPVRYFISHEDRNRGPFDRQLIEAFLLSGYFPPDIQVREEGKDTWAKWNTVINPPSPPIPTRSAQHGGPSRKKWWVFGGAAAIALFFFFKFLGESSEQKTESVTLSSTPSSTLPASSWSPSPSYTSSSTPYRSTALSTYDPPTTQSGVSPTYQTYPGTTATPSSDSFVDESGQTYLVPHADYIRLSKQRETLTLEAASLEKALKAFETLQTQLKSEGSRLDRTSQKAINAYNRKIDDYDALKARLKKRTEAYDRAEKAFNTELERVGTRQ